MKSATVLQFAAAISIALAASARADDGAQTGHPLPPGVAAQINLGKAGLLEMYGSSEMFGLSEQRLGDGRETIGQAQATGVTAGYTDKTTGYTIPLSLVRPLSDGRSYLRFGLTGTYGTTRPGLIANTASIYSLDIQYMTFPNPDTMLAFGLTGESPDVQYASTTIGRSAYGPRLDVIRKLNEHWGIYGRIQYMAGTTKTTVNIAPGLQNILKQGDNRIYGQVNLVGQFRNGDMGFIPQGWVLHPMIGALYLHAHLQTVADNFGNVRSGVTGPEENYGLLYGQLELAREVPPGQWAPSFAVGVEHETVNSLKQYLDEPNYGVISFGLSRVSASGSRIGLLYSRHQGFTGKQWTQGLVAAITFTF